MDMVDLSEFLDLLYAAPFKPDLWVPTMERLADMVGGSSAWLSRLSVADGSGSGIIARIDPMMPQRYIEHFGQRNPFVIKRDPRRYIREWQPTIRFHDDFLPREEVVRTEFYNDFLGPQDIRASMMIGLAVDGIETCVLNVNSPREDFAAEGVEVARRLHVHLRRAFDLSRKLGSGHGGDPPLVIDGGHHAVFLVDAVGRVSFANPLAQRLTGPGCEFRLVDGCLTASDRAASARLARLIGSATASDVGDRGGTLAIVRAGGPPLEATIAPLPRRADGVFADAPLAMIWITDPNIVPRGVADRIRDLYGLTPAETRLGVALLDGSSPREVAAALGIGFQTVRNQLQALYGKTQTNRQSALVLLLANAGRTTPG